MSYKTAQILGALLAVLLVGGVLLVGRALPPPCQGALRVELRPPLKGPATFHFSLDTAAPGSAERHEHCEFDVTLSAKAEVTRKQCAYPWQLQLREARGEVAITGMLLGATPEHLSLAIRGGDELLYDTELQPTYDSNITALRPESGEERFCGRAALLKAPCVRGSSQCVPFAALCDGPEDCGAGHVCCAAPAWGMEYGARNSMECSTRGQCAARIESYVACHSDSDCTSGFACEAGGEGESFKPALQLCTPKRVKDESKPL
jgi:hypothetical protein